MGRSEDLLLSDCNSGEKTTFRGPRTFLDEEDVRTPHDLSARNVEYITEGQVRTRRGIDPVWNPNLAIQTLHNWRQSTFHRLLYLHSNSFVRTRNLETLVDELIVNGGIGAPTMMTPAEYGQRIIMAFSDANGAGTTEARIWDGLFTSGVANVEKVFPRALQTTDIAGGVFTVSEPAGGVITQGSHNLGVILRTKNGGISPPGIVVGGVFTPVTHNASGGKKLQITINPASSWPNWFSTGEVIMTPVENPAQYYVVPGSSFAITGGSPIPAVVTINLDDVTLTSKGSPADEYFNLYAQSVGGSGPFSPYFIGPYNDRMVYITLFPGPDLLNLTSGAFISKKGDPQWITLSRHLIQLPEFKLITCAHQLDQTLNIFGPDWTWAYTDNQRDPVYWPTPRQVDGKIGSPFINGVVKNVSKSYLWVGARQGLFCYRGGVYDSKPSSFHQTDLWRQINWAAPQQTFSVVEYSDRHQVHVYCAYGPGQTTCNRVLVWDYQEGYTFDKIRFCGIWNYSPIPSIGGRTNVLNPATKTNEIWMASNTAGKVWRTKHEPDDSAVTLYNDDGAGIDSAYKTGSMGGVSTGPRKWVGASFRVRGAGAIGLNVYSLDQVRTKVLAAINATLAPGKEFFRWINIESEACSIEVTNQAQANSYFIWSYMKVWWKRWLARRG